MQSVVKNAEKNNVIPLVTQQSANSGILKNTRQMKSKVAAYYVSYKGSELYELAQTKDVGVRSAQQFSLSGDVERNHD